MEDLREAKVIVVRPWTMAKGRAAVLKYLKGRPATLVSDIAEVLGMDLDLAFRVVDSLAREGRVGD